ncbi:hypothetical protein Bbelb_409060 [Branchiostoma belcheri]|nr:hypothetical protein Bbelb_409060 [Branchiostoma belcheri]
MEVLNSPENILYELLLRAEWKKTLEPPKQVSASGSQGHQKSGAGPLHEARHGKDLNARRYSDPSTVLRPGYRKAGSTGHSVLVTQFGGHSTLPVGILVVLRQPCSPYVAAAVRQLARLYYRPAALVSRAILTPKPLRVFQYGRNVQFSVSRTDSEFSSSEVASDLDAQF